MSLDVSAPARTDIEACITLTTEIAELLKHIGETTTSAREPVDGHDNEWTQRNGTLPLGAIYPELHRLAGCIAPLRLRLHSAMDFEAGPDAREILADIESVLDSAAKTLAEFRSEWIDLRSPGTLTDAIQRSARTFENVLPVAVTVEDHDAFGQLAANRFVAAFLEEALTNVWKHGAGPVQLIGRFDEKHDEVLISVRDSGPGFDPDKVRRGQGLVVLRESASALGGRLLISIKPSTVTLAFPVDI